MTLEEYGRQMDAALEKLDWRDPGSKESEAYRLLAKASTDKGLTTAEWQQLYNRYREGVKKL